MKDRKRPPVFRLHWPVFISIGSLRKAPSTPSKGISYHLDNDRDPVLQ